MILISHRGNTNGRFESYENEPNYIDKALAEGYDVEIDVRYERGMWYLGHDKPQYGVLLCWLEDRKEKLWIHCKNTEAIEKLSICEDFNYFWHEEDTLTLTSKRFIWAYPGKQPIKNSIAVMPELYKDEVSQSIGVCSDIIEHYLHKTKLIQ